MRQPMNARSHLGPSMQIDTHHLSCLEQKLYLTNTHHGCFWGVRRGVPLSGLLPRLAGLVCFFTAPLLCAQQSLTLNEAINSALTSPTALMLDEQVNEARAQVLQAHLGPNPRLFLQSEDIRPWDSQFSYTSQTEDYAYLTQTLELDRKRHKRVGVAQADLRISETERELRRQLLIAGVAASYWKAVSAQSIVALLHTDLAEVEEIVRYHKHRVDAGAMRGVDLIRVQIERDRVYLSLQTAQRDAAIARAELFRQIGQQDFSSIQLTGDVSTVRALPPIDVEIALSRRLDLKVAVDQLASAQENVRLQQAVAVPDIDLSAGYKRNSANNTLYFSSNIPLPVRNRNQGEIDRARAQVRLAEDQVRQTEIAARSDIDTASIAYQQELEIVQQTLPDLREHARQNLSIMTEAYRIGGVDLLRYIDAERTEIDVEINALRTLAEFQQIAVRLQIATGERP